MSVKRRWKIAIAAAALIAIVAAFVLATHDPEPTYKGHTLSEWFSAYVELHHVSWARGDSESAKSSDAGQALRAMSPAALPTLIEWLCYEQPAFLASIQYEVYRLFGSYNKLYAMMGRKQTRVSETFIVFEALGTNASPAIPQLTKIVMDPKKTKVAYRALHAMASTGKPGLQAIVDLLHNPKTPNRANTLLALSSCTAIDQETVMRELRQHLTDSDAQMRTTASNAVWNLEHPRYPGFSRR
jgi:hypothetical protein